MQIQELMTEHPATSTPDSGLQEVTSLMVEHDAGAIPVVDNNEPVGIVTDRDVACRVVAKGQNPLEKRAKDAMTSPVVTVRPSDSVEEVERRMKDEKVRRVVVTDDGKVRGIVAQADLARRTPEEEAGEVVRDVSEPTSEASKPGAER